MNKIFKYKILAWINLLKRKPLEAPNLSESVKRGCPNNSSLFRISALCLPDTIYNTLSRVSAELCFQDWSLWSPSG